MLNQAEIFEFGWKQQNINNIKALKVDVKKIKLIEDIFVLISNNSRGRVPTVQKWS